MITIVAVLILLVVIASGLVNLNPQGRIDDTMGEVEIKGACDHFQCPQGSCCKEGGGTDYQTRQCIKNDTESLRDTCTDATGERLGSTYVKEYYCDGNIIRADIHYCGTNSCMNGACT